jgi:hypothetical protein
MAQVTSFNYIGEVFNIVIWQNFGKSDLEVGELYISRPRGRCMKKGCFYFFVFSVVLVATTPGISDSRHNSR